MSTTVLTYTYRRQILHVAMLTHHSCAFCCILYSPFMKLLGCFIINFKYTENKASVIPRGSTHAMHAWAGVQRFLPCGSITV